MDDPAQKTADLEQSPPAGAPKRGASALLAGAADVAGAAEQAVFHAVITAAKGVEHALGAVVKMGWDEFHALVEAGKARPASAAEVARALPPAPEPQPESGQPV